MSFDLTIKLPKGFAPSIPTVEMPPLTRDPDRTEDEDRLWQQMKYEEAVQAAKDAAWAPFSKNLSIRSMVFVKEVLRRSGATFSSTARGVGKKLPRGPGREVDARKLGSNDGWLLTPAECTFVAGRLRTWLDQGGDVFQFRDLTWNLTPAAEDKDDIATRKFLYELSAFFSRAAEYRGLEVW